MTSFIQEFNQFPRPVRATFQTFIVAWAWLFFSLYKFFLKGEIPIEMIAIGIMLFIALALFKKWARILTIVFNFLAIMMFLWLAARFYYGDKQQLIYIALLNVALYTTSTFFLLNKDTKAFFIKKSDEKENKKAKEIEKHVKTAEQLRKKHKKKTK